MERNAEPCGVRPGRPEQLDGFVERRAKLAGQVIDRVAARQGKPDEEPQYRRVADQPDPHRLLQDLGELVGAVEREVGDTP